MPCGLSVRTSSEEKTLTGSGYGTLWSHLCVRGTSILINSLVGVGRGFDTDFKVQVLNGTQSTQFFLASIG